MGETQNSLVTVEIIDGVAVIKLDDGKANALSLPMQSAFNSALDQAQQAKLPVVITGRSGILSAGFDLKTLAASGQPAVDMLNGGIEIAIRLLSFETPVVVACGGHAIAMGVFLLQCGDYRIGVAGNFKYSANEVAIGMTMPWSTIEILRQRLTPAALSRAVLLAETFTPTNGVENGLIDRVVATEAELLPTALGTAKSFSALNGAAHVASKNRLRGEVVAAIRDGLAKDLDGWKKLFL
ncbi:MAG: crotonase/enoyl-CoA hydratase family protein [Acidimicrobiia bacterium]|nr:crotonase/enoyl-CoA hydratase family protein [Acidimicrobiia bacterium]